MEAGAVAASTAAGRSTNLAESAVEDVDAPHRIRHDGSCHFHPTSLDPYQ